MINFVRISLLIISTLIFSVILHAQIVPYDTLYNQTLTPSGNVEVSSHFFENGYETTYSCMGADDFTCTRQWRITKVFALGGFYNGSQNPQTFHISIYADDNPAGNLPGTELFNYYNTVQDNGNGGFTIPINEDITLSPGHYWISVYANVATGYREWGWKPSSGSYNYEAVWENPGDGFGTGFTSWTPITTAFNGTTETDYSFALFGINGIPASNPNPPDNALAVDLNQNLMWQNPSDAVSINVLFGTDPDNLTSIYSGIPITTIDQGTMQYYTNYYWRVDENDGNGTATGVTWHFSTIQDPSLALNENFDSYGFPPAGWTLENSGASLWDKYYTVSAYGQGANSARAQFFLSAIADSISSMITQTFYALPGGDTLSFDYAYEQAYGDDQLEILYSTDSGTSWQSLVLLHGGFNGELVTAPYSYLEFVPDANQWGTLKFAVPAGTDRFKFRAINGHGNDLFLDNIKIVNQLVPVELTSFSADFVNNEVRLNWITATEKNNKGFEIEKSQGSDINNLSWEKIGFVEGSGTTTKSHSYTFIDSNVRTGSYSYRLKQINFDGTYDYSKIIEEKVSAPAKYALMQNYPNPFNPATQINFSLPVDAGVKITIYNVLGQEVKQLVNDDYNAGNHSINFNASNFSSGLYFYVLEAKGVNGSSFTSTRKMMLVK